MTKLEPIKFDDKSIQKVTPDWSYEIEVDNPIMAMEYWTEQWLAHPLRNKFRTLKEFISWSMSQEDQPFNRGGIV